MKKIILVTIAFISIATATVKAQESKSFIEVVGTTTYKRTVEQYNVTIIITEDALYNNGSERFAELKETYLTRVKDSGIDTSKLKENEFQYLTTGYVKEGTVLSFETKFKDELIKLLKIKSRGVIIYNRYATYKPTDIEALSKKAIENARQKAEGIAKNINKKLGTIIAIEDNNSTEIREAIYEDSTVVPVNYRIIVRFELLK
jgi:uncharacterized protein YggE